MVRLNIAGLTFSRLTAIRYSHTLKGNAYWHVRCACGTEKVVPAHRMNSNQIKSCGCLRKDSKFPIIIKHGEARRGQMSKLHVVWQGIKQRCLTPSCTAYRWYGGRGIGVAPIWLEFAAFRDWAREAGYVEGLVIDRIEPDGDYEPSNCRWITPEENNARARRWGSVTAPRPRRKRTNYNRASDGRFIVAA